MLNSKHQGKSQTTKRVMYFNGGSNGKESAGNAGDPSLIPGSGRSPAEGNGYPLQYSCLENSMGSRAWWAIVHVVTKSQTHLSNYHFHFFFGEKSKHRKEELGRGWNGIRVMAGEARAGRKMRNLALDSREETGKWDTGILTSLGALHRPFWLHPRASLGLLSCFLQALICPLS